MRRPQSRSKRAVRKNVMTGDFAFWITSRSAPIRLTRPGALATGLLRLRLASIGLTWCGAKVAESIRLQYQLRGNWRRILSAVETDTGSRSFQEHCHCDHRPVQRRNT